MGESERVNTKIMFHSIEQENIGELNFIFIKLTPHHLFCQPLKKE